MTFSQIEVDNQLFQNSNKAELNSSNTLFHTPCLKYQAMNALNKLNMYKLFINEKMFPAKQSHTQSYNFTLAPRRAKAIIVLYLIMRRFRLQSNLKLKIQKVRNENK